MYINLSGLQILVTGSSRGIGKAIAEKLAEAGAYVGVHFNNNKREADKVLHSLGSKAAIFQADLSQPEQCTQLFDEVMKQMGGIDVIINNAGIAISSPLDAKDEDWVLQWQKTMNTNLLACALLCKKGVAHWLKEKKTGRIINIASRAAFRGDTPEYLAYAASKGGMVALTRSIARAYGKQGIRAFTVAPGFIRTEMAQDFIKQYGEELVLSDLAMEKLTEPKDVAPLITLLASGLADHANGTTIDVNAGSYVH